MVDMNSPNKEDIATVAIEGEDEKERTIAKAALSIAELGEIIRLHSLRYTLNSSYSRPA